MGAWWVCVCGGAGERLGAGGEAGRSGAPARARTPARGHPASRSASSRAPRARGLERGRLPPPPSPPLPGRPQLSRLAAGPGGSVRLAGYRRGRPGLARRRGSGALEQGQRRGVQGAAPGRRREGTAHTSAGASHTPRAPAAPGCPGRAPHPPASLGGSGSTEPEGPRPRGRRARGGGESPGRPGQDALGGFAGFPGPLCFRPRSYPPALPTHP